MDPNIKKLYRDVCFRYFPRWNPWELVFNPHPKLINRGILGYCNVSERKIGLVRPSKAALIHEICHAITTKKHGTAWSYRMQKAIETVRVKNHQYDITERFGIFSKWRSRVMISLSLQSASAAITSSKSPIGQNPQSDFPTGRVLLQSCRMPRTPTRPPGAR